MLASAHTHTHTHKHTLTSEREDVVDSGEDGGAGHDVPRSLSPVETAKELFLQVCVYA